MQRTWLILAGVSGFLAVAAGTFGAHGLDVYADRLNLEAAERLHMADVFDVGVRYHMYHTLVLLSLAGIAPRPRGRLFNVAGWMFVAGIIIFSGTLYALAITHLRWLGMITPVGGVFFLAGWMLLAIGAARLQGGSISNSRPVRRTEPNSSP